MTPRGLLDGDVIHDPEFVQMSWLAQILWYRLWHLADSWGYGVWEAKVLKVECFPLDKRVSDAKLTIAMGEVSKSCRLKVLEAKGQRFFSLMDWEEVNKGIKHRKPSWMQKLLVEAGLQLKLAAQRQSTENNAKPVPDVDVGVDIGIVAGAGSPSGKNAVDEKPGMTAEEIEKAAREHLHDDYDTTRHLSAPVQERIKALAKKMTMPGSGLSSRRKLTDKEICERLQWTPEELKAKRAAGIKVWMDVPLE